MATTQMNGSAGELKAPVRNRYYYGKMLDVFHFELEQDYFNQKRWLINQRIVGTGVVCGLDVTPSQDQRSLIVQPGLAIDRCGREIVVSCPSAPVCLDPWLKPPAPPPATAPGNATGTTAAADNGKWLHLCLCYHECETDPEPAFGGDCDTDARCSSGAIRERYRIDVCEGKVNPIQAKCNLSELFSKNTLDYAALTRFITRACPKTPESCCIPLANIQVPAVPSQYSSPGGTTLPQLPPLVVDITIRPVVLSNPLLYQLMLCLCSSNGETPCSGSSY